MDYVRQGAFIAAAMVLIQHTAAKEPRVDTFRKSIMDSVESKNDTMTKFGAIMAAGILDAGGRNVTLSLLSSGGHKKAAAIVGMALFPQFWYWYPLCPMLSLAFTPTAVIGLNKDLNMPADFRFVSNAPASHFAYPSEVEIKKEEKKKKAPTALLSATKAKQNRARRRNAADKPADDADPSLQRTISSASTVSAAPGESKDETKDADGKEVKETKASEPTFVDLTNPSRVTPTQQAVITVPQDQRYRPLTKRIAGFVMLMDTNPNDPENLVNHKTIKVGQPGVGDNEPAVPADFQFNR
jgi:26S proteasome regulatory subunit N2